VIEALDGGDPSREVEHKDHLYFLDSKDGFEVRLTTRIPSPAAGV